MAASRKVFAAKQSNIKSFFSIPQQPKRSGSFATDENVPPAKITKTEIENVMDKENFAGVVMEDFSSEIFSSPEIKVTYEKSKLHNIRKVDKEDIVRIDLGGSMIDIGRSWRDALQGEFDKDYFKRLSKFLTVERKTKIIYPPENEVFSWTKLHHIRKTKVVILGQDPYHGPNQAHGLCFSVGLGVPPPPSLKNMYKELENDVPGFVKPDHGYLLGWASQGVLLLNACLTVVGSQANSHKDRGWEKFTDATIMWLNRNLDGVVFILWGMYAQKKGASINKSRHLVLSGKHPSPLSAHGGFFGCKHFSKANAYLKENGKKEIDWKYLPESI